MFLLLIIVFAEAATSVADGTRDAALEAARMSADAKDVAAFKSGNTLSNALHQPWREVQIPLFV